MATARKFGPAVARSTVERSKGAERGFVVGNGAETALWQTQPPGLKVLKVSQIVSASGGTRTRTRLSTGT
jgi:hypothetical protein